MALLWRSVSGIFFFFLRSYLSIYTLTCLLQYYFSHIPQFSKTHGIKLVADTLHNLNSVSLKGTCYGGNICGVALSLPYKFNKFLCMII